MTILPPLLSVLLLPLTVACGSATVENATPSLKLVQTIPLPGVSGRIDHLSLDEEGNRLFVAALGADTVEVVDLERGVRVARLTGLSEPQGVSWLPGPRKLVVTNGGGSSATIFAGEGLEERTTVALRADPDNVRYDEDTGNVWVGEGTGAEGALSALDPRTNERVVAIPVGGHPESFQLERDGDRAFVNVPATQEVVVVDRKRGEVVARHRLPGGANYPMALDEVAGRLYVAGRTPPRLYVLDTTSGDVVASVDVPGDADDLFVDPTARVLYTIAGEGSVRRFTLAGDGTPEPAGDQSTADGARTGLLDRAGERLFVAAPRRGDEEARILVFRPT